MASPKQDVSSARQERAQLGTGEQPVHCPPHSQQVLALTTAFSALSVDGASEVSYHRQCPLDRPSESYDCCRVL